MTYQEHIRQLAAEAGLAYGGKNEDGEDTFIGSDREWEAFRQMKQTLDKDWSDPSEGVPWHPDYGKEMLATPSVEDIPF